MNEAGGWEAVRQVLRGRVGAPTYNAWFRTLAGSADGDRLLIRCPDRFSRDWIRARYAEAVAAAAAEVSGGTVDVEYVVEAPETVPARRPSRPTVAAANAPAVAPERSFESFVVGPGNALALEASRALARGQAGRCSPLVLAGSSGVGKTHLCRAIQHNVGEGVVYRSSEEFTTEVTRGMRSGRMDEVRRRYRRSLNVLILEDVQFLAGKRATQAELFHTLDHLLTRGKPVVFSSERPPHEIQGLDDGLRSRMASGLVACIAPPELETRRAILREKAAGGGVRVPEACLELLAQRPAASVRDLLGGLNQVVARASLLRQPVTPELVAVALSAVDIVALPRGLEEIIDMVGRAYDVSRDELRSRSRRRRVTRPRQIAMYLCRRYSGASLQEIGRALDRDHTSVLYAIDAVERRTVESPQLRYELEALAGRLGPRPAATKGRRSGAGSTRGTRRT